MEMDTEAVSSNAYIEQQLASYLTALEGIVSGDALAVIAPIYPMLDELVRKHIEAIPHKASALYVLLETSGGLIEVTERIANIFRQFYQEVNFIVPDQAMSAGTVLVMSGDNIYMDYFSALGPIDPQVQNKQGRFVPALGYLAEYKKLVQKSEEGRLTAAELAFMMQKFDPGELYAFERASELSVELLEEWLTHYKFKNWRETEARGLPVDDAMRAQRAQEIAKALNESSRWKTHSRYIPMVKLREQMKLQIEDFGGKPELDKAIHCYWDLLCDYLHRRGKEYVLHSRSRFQML